MDDNKRSASPKQSSTPIYPSLTSPKTTEGQTSQQNSPRERKKSPVNNEFDEDDEQRL